MVAGRHPRGREITRNRSAGSFIVLSARRVFEPSTEDSWPRRVQRSLDSSSTKLLLLLVGTIAAVWVEPNSPRSCRLP